MLHSFSRGLRRVAGTAGLLVLLALIISPAATAATPGTFTTLASSPNPVNNVAVDPATNIIYAQQFGGTGFYSYNPSTDTWTTLATAPLSQGNNGGGAYLNGKIYTVYTGNSSQMGVYDIATNTWTTTTNPLGQGTGNIVASGGLLYLVVGTSFVSYDPATNTTTTLAAAPGFPDSNCPGCGFQRWGALAVYNGKIYGTQGNSHNGFAVYDIASNSWTELPLVPGGTVLGGAIDPITGTYYAYGTYGGSNFYAFDIASGAWTTLTFPYNNLDDGGLAYVSTPGLQGIYATYGEGSTGFTRFNTPAPASVSLKKSASHSRVTVGHGFSYTLKATNSGGFAADAVTVIDKLPSQVKLDKATASQGTCSGTTTVTCNLGTLDAGASATVTLKVTAKKAAKTKNTATLSTTSPNASTATSSSADVTIIAPALKLSVTPHSATAGRVTCYAFKATSGGKAVHGAKVALGGHRATTSKAGKARLCLSLTKGTHHARVTKSGYKAATAAIRVHAAAAPPAFTG